MCGIFFYLSKNDTKNHYTNYEYLYNNGLLCQHRGPDKTTELQLSYLNYDMYFMFHRLAINGLSDIGDQPLKKQSIILICNGEIYNYKKLIKEYKLDDTMLQGHSDCEVIIDLYLKLGIDETIRKLDGVFSFVLYDINKNKIFIGHDPIGVRSLYWFHSQQHIGVCSEMKSLVYYSPDICMFPNGSYSEIKLLNNKIDIDTTRYYKIDYPIKYFDEKDIIKNIRIKLENAVVKRLMCERENVSCLLSGGLDSSIITALAAKHLGKIDTYSIGFKDSVDVKHSEIVAKHLNTNHTSVIVTEKEMLDAIEETIKQIESYDTTTIRASVPMLLLSKYIKKNSKSKVILSGEGADETSGSYMYFHNAPNAEEFKKETFRLIKDNRYFDILRADKTTAGAGLELRVPFYDKDFLNYYMSIDPKLKMVRHKYEKYLLRKTFEDLLPKEIAWRRKDGFSDGVSSFDKPWYSIIEEYTLCKYNLSELSYYKYIFDKYYKNYDNIIPYLWNHKWSKNLNNPSNRTINI